jgi:hypothetical protein
MAVHKKKFEWYRSDRTGVDRGCCRRRVGGGNDTVAGKTKTGDKFSIDRTHGHCAQLCTGWRMDKISFFLSMPVFRCAAARSSNSI